MPLNSEVNEEAFLTVRTNMHIDAELLASLSGDQKKWFAQAIAGIIVGAEHKNIG